MPLFNYAKVSDEGSQDDTLEQQPMYRGPERHGWWRKIVAKVRALHWPVLFFLLLAVLMCEISILRKQSTPMQLGDERNGIIPSFSVEQKVFHADDRYASDHKTMESYNATMAHWLDLMPRGGGFKDVPDHSSHKLPEPMHFPGAPSKEVFAIAVFHELHCLMHINGFVDRLVMQIRNKNWKLDESEVAHNDHCFNYVRNALLCCGDTTLEGQTQQPELKNIPGTDGTGAVHLCRNYDEVFRYAEKVRIGDDKGN